MCYLLNTCHVLNVCATHYLLNPNFVVSENLTYKYLNGVYFDLGEQNNPTLVIPRYNNLSDKLINASFASIYGILGLSVFFSLIENKFILISNFY